MEFILALRDEADYFETMAKAAITQDISAALGPIIIGYVDACQHTHEQTLTLHRFTLDLALFGTLIHQAVLWHQNYSDERVFIRAIAVSPSLLPNSRLVLFGIRVDCADVYR